MRAQTLSTSSRPNYEVEYPSFNRDPYYRIQYPSRSRLPDYILVYPAPTTLPSFQNILPPPTRAIPWNNDCGCPGQIISEPYSSNIGRFPGAGRESVEPDFSTQQANEVASGNRDKFPDVNADSVKKQTLIQSSKDTQNEPVSARTPDPVTPTSSQNANTQIVASSVATTPTIENKNTEKTKTFTFKGPLFPGGHTYTFIGDIKDEAMASHINATIAAQATNATAKATIIVGIFAFLGVVLTLLVRRGRS